MRLPLNLMIVVVAILAAVGVWYASGGRVVLFVLPLLFGLPLLSRMGRRVDRNRGRDHI